MPSMWTHYCNPADEGEPWDAPEAEDDDDPDDEPMEQIQINVTIVWTTGASLTFAVEDDAKVGAETLAEQAKKLAYREIALDKRDFAVIVLGDRTGQHEVIANPAMWTVRHVEGSIRRDPPPGDGPCQECGGSGYAHCAACNDGGVNAAGMDCVECPKPCPACEPPQGLDGRPGALVERLAGVVEPEALAVPVDDADARDPR